MENLLYRSNHDAIAIKNMNDSDQRNVTVRRCVIWKMTNGNGLEKGLEIRSSRASKVRLEDNGILRLQRGATIIIDSADGAVIEDIVYDEILVEDAGQKPIDFTMLLGKHASDRPSPEQCTFCCHVREPGTAS